MKNKINYTALILMLMAIGFFGCENSVESEEVIDDVETVVVEDDENHDNSDDYSWDESDEIQIVLADNATVISGSGASITGNVLTISSAGTYNISGSLSDGQIIISSDDEDLVRLILNDIDINCSSSSPIYFLNADKGMIVLAENTNNKLSDGSSYSSLGLVEDDPSAAIFSMADLTIHGLGTLTIDANYSDGITSKDGLIISSGNIDITAEDDGIRGKDYLIIYDGNISIDADGIGLKSDNSDDDSRGYINIENGDFNINSGGNGIDAVKDIEILYGDFNISSDGKGINGTTSVSISAGNFEINSGDDAIHSNGAVTINDGDYTISSSDDGIHADYNLVINGGNINIIKSYEGIESYAGDITINGGEIHILSSDDGLNLAAGGDSGPNGSSGNYYLNINDGYIVVNSGGDGVDANANVVMSNGTLIVSGSTASSNSAIDYDGAFQMNGGFLVATGTSKMAEAPGASSSQNSILVNFSSTESAGYLIHIENQNGEDVLTIAPNKSYQSLAFSSAALITGSSYDIYLGGSSTGTQLDGVYKDGAYSSGIKYSSFTISSTVTNIN